MARPMLMRLSEITPSPTQRFIPSWALYRQRLSPCRTRLPHLICAQTFDGITCRSLAT
jgi:hypothetical protein